MRKSKYIFLLAMCGAMSAQAGNKERIGQAGANELLINPWAASSGLGGANSAHINGVEGFNWNISSLGAINKTELYYSNVTLFSGSDVRINSIGFGQRVGDFAVMGISVNAMSFGDIPITTTANPDGGQGTFSPQFMNIALAYTRNFSNRIQGGGAVRVISESINNVGSTGVALDAGIRYTTGKYDRAKFGIALRNVGPKMNYGGDGLATTVVLQDAEFTVSQRAAGFEMPALLHIGASYDFYLFPTSSEVEGEAADENAKPSDFRLTVCGTFTSNSFSADQFRGGVEFGFKDYLAVRGGLVYEPEGFASLSNGRTNAYTGPALGLTAKMPMKKNPNTGFSFDYAYRFANPLGGTHNIGLRLSI